jgi:protein-S-isoprenylcysteine O-methyltransferase Ste14
VKKFLVNYAIIIVVLAVLVLIVKGDFFSRSPLVIAGQVIAILLLVWARVTFRGQEFSFTARPGNGPLIRRGPYRFVRHPMYAGGLLLIWSAVLGHWSLLNGAIGIVVTVLVFVKISLEEHLLRQRYPDYSVYAGQTKRLVPFIY